MYRNGPAMWATGTIFHQSNDMGQMNRQLLRWPSWLPAQFPQIQEHIQAVKASGVKVWVVILWSQWKIVRNPTLAPYPHHQIITVI